MTEIPAGSINASLVLTPAVIAALRSQGWLAPDENEPAKIGLAVAQLLTAPLRSNFRGLWSGIDQHPHPPSG